MTTYYLRLDGSNGNNGLSDASGGAWATHAYALTRVAPGDIVNSGPGTFYERLLPTISGTASQRITFNSNGTIIDGTSAVSGTWIAAPEVGAGVWSIDSASSGITGAGALMERTTVQLLHQISMRYMDGEYIADSYGMGGAFTGFAALAVEPDFFVPFNGCLYWDGKEALWGFRRLNNRAYVRYRNGDDPNTKNLGWSPSGIQNSGGQPPYYGGPLHLKGVSYYTWNNYTFQGGYTGVFFDNGARNNLVDRGKIWAAHNLTFFYDDCSDNIVRPTEMRSRLIGFISHPVARSRIASVYDNDANVAYQQYSDDKFVWGETSEADSAFRITDGSNGRPTRSEVGNCEITQGPQGANWAFGGDQTYWHDCHVHHHASQGIYFQGYYGPWGLPTNFRIDRNIFRINGYTSMRTNGLNYWNVWGKCYFTNNGISDVDGDGNLFYLADTDPSNPGATSPQHGIDLWLAHNSFSGGATIMIVGGPTQDGLPKFVNNIYSMAGTWRQLMDCTESSYTATRSRIKAWAHSAHLGFFTNTNPPAWWDDGNFSLSGPIWPVHQAEQNFVLPAGHPCRNAGLDVSKPFTIRGVQYDALPGFPSNYFGTALAPHMGAWQEAGAISPDEKSIMTSPIAGSTFSGSSVTFIWSAGVNVTEYWINLGTEGIDSGNIYSASQGSNLSKTVTGIPTTGQQIYVRLWSKIAGVWPFNDYIYSAFTASGGAPGEPSPAPGPASAAALQISITIQ